MNRKKFFAITLIAVYLLFIKIICLGNVIISSDFLLKLVWAKFPLYKGLRTNPYPDWEVENTRNFLNQFLKSSSYQDIALEKLLFYHYPIFHQLAKKGYLSIPPSVEEKVEAILNKSFETEDYLLLAYAEAYWLLNYKLDIAQHLVERYKKRKEQCWYENFKTFHSLKDIKEAVQTGELVRVPDYLNEYGIINNAVGELDPKNKEWYWVAYPETVGLMYTVAYKYKKALNNPRAKLYISGLIRTEEYQKLLVHYNYFADNIRSTHTQGVTFDITVHPYYSTPQQLEVLRNILIEMEQLGEIDFIDEIDNSCFHVCINPHYAIYYYNQWNTIESLYKAKEFLSAYSPIDTIQTLKLLERKGEVKRVTPNLFLRKGGVELINILKKQIKALILPLPVTKEELKPLAELLNYKIAFKLNPENLSSIQKGALIQTLTELQNQEYLTYFIRDNYIVVLINPSTSLTLASVSSKINFLSLSKWFLILAITVGILGDLWVKRNIRKRLNKIRNKRARPKRVTALDWYYKDGYIEFKRTN